MPETLRCVGVIFHIGQGGVLFEFSDGSAEDLVGFVAPNIIKISKDEKIPATADTPEKLSKYLQVGDELHCRVFKNTKLQKLSYTEDEEEIDKNGEIVKSIKKVEIQPEWEATVAALAGVSDLAEMKMNPSEEHLDTNEVGELEEQLDNMFDYDDVIFIEEVDIPDIEDGNKTGGETSDKQEPSKAVDEVSKKDENKSSPKSVLTQKKATRIFYPPTSSPGVTNKNETFFDRAKLVQLKKPNKGIIDGKVSAGVFEILSGQFVNKRVTVINSSMFIWGHHMGIANLMRNVRFGDECTIEHQISRHTKPHNMGSRDFVVPTVINLWFGRQTSTPVKNDEPEYLSWLAERKIDEKEFLRWLKNQVPPKPYFPFVTNFLQCKVIGYVRQDNFSAKGVILEIGQAEDSKNLAQEKNIEKSLEDVQPENDSKNLAILAQEDFYICGVCVCNSDLRLLLKIDDIIQCQVQPITNTDRILFKKELAQYSNLKVTHVGVIGFVGPQAPTQANLASSYAPCLDKFLKAKGISLAEFEAMRYPKAEQMPFMGQFFPNQPPVPFLGPRGPFMNFRGPPPMIRPVEGQGMIPPPQGALPGVIGPFIPQVPIAHISIATNLAARAINITVDDMRVRNLLHNPNEMEIAAKITQIFTKALMLKMQGSIQTRLDSNLPTIPKLESQYAEISQIVNKIEKFKQSPSSFTKSLSMPPASNSQNSNLKTRIQEPVMSPEVTGLTGGTKRPGPAFSGTLAKVPRVESKEFGSLGMASSDNSLPKQTLPNLTLPPPIMPLPPPTVLPATDLSVPPPMGLPPTNISVPPPSLLEPIPLDNRPSLSSQQLPMPRQSSQQEDYRSLSPIRQTFDKQSVLPLPAGMKKNQFDSFEDSFAYNDMDARKERETQYQKELEQQKLWEDYQREKKRKEEEEEMRMNEEKRQKLRAIEDKLEKMRQREEQERIHYREEQERIRRQQEEQERARRQEEQERLRRQQEEQERARRQEELERARRQQEEQERARRQQEEQERLRRQEQEEQERIRREEVERRRIREEFERKKLLRLQEEELKRAEEQKRLEEERLKKFRQLREEEERIRLKKLDLEKDWKLKEQERLWKIEMERRLKLQHQDDELERKQMELEEQRKREILMSKPPPPPKINKHLMQPAKNPPNPFYNFGTGVESQKRQQTEALESRMKGPPPPPRFSDNFGQNSATVKQSWSNNPQTSYSESARQHVSANQPSLNTDRRQMWNPENQQEVLKHQNDPQNQGNQSNKPPFMSKPPPPFYSGRRF